MRSSRWFRVPLAALWLSVLAVCFAGSPPAPSAPPAPQAYGNLPLAFEPNAGQFDPQVRFVTHSPGMTVFFTDDGAVMVLHKRPAGKPMETELVRMKLAGADRLSRSGGLEKLPGISNYFLGNDPANWRTGIPNYARIQYRNVYPGIDLVAYGNQRQLEYDLVVSPGADPGRIALAWDGADGIELNGAGDLVLSTRLGNVVQKRPRVYQPAGGRRLEIDARYALGAGGRVQLALAGYDRRLPLVIDPITLVYATYLGSSNQGDAIAVDSTGAAYVAGDTTDTNFPVKSAFQRTNNTNRNDCSNSTTFVTKFAPSGSSLVYSTYLGGTCSDTPNGIAVDSTGAAYIVGTANSTDFPLASPYQRSCSANSYGGVYVAKLAPAGNSLAYSTYLCGGYEDAGGGIAVDSSGSAYVTGTTHSDNWPVQSAFQPLLAGYSAAFVTKLSPAGNSLVYSTYLGGGGYDGGNAIAVDTAGAAYVTGYTESDDFPTANAFQSAYKNQNGNDWGDTVFVTKLAPAGNSLVWSTFLGGAGGDEGRAIAVDAGQAAFVTGVTYSTDFPLHNAMQSTNKNPNSGTCFVTKFVTAGTSLAYSTYLGGSDTGGPSGDACYGIAVDVNKQAYLTGITYSPDFPLLSAFQSSFPDTNIAFVTRLSSTGTLSYSTFAGGQGDAQANAIALDSAGGAYVTGSTTAQTGLATSGAYQTSTSGSGGPFVAKVQGPFTAGTSVSTSPAGLTFSVDGTNYTAAQTFTWTAGSTHTIGVASPQTLAGVSGTRYLWANWSDSGLENHSITASASGGSYTANFTTQYLLTVAEAPSAGGTVAATPSSPDGYYNSGTSVQLKATANTGYTFANWTGGLTGTGNPQSVTMSGPQTVTANFSSGGSGPNLSITKTHNGNFTQGQTNATYTLTVTNQAGAGATSGTVTVSDAIPAYLTLVTMSGTGWNCLGNACARSDVLAGGASYPAITVAVNVAANAPSQVTNQAAVTDNGVSPVTVSDVTTIVSATTTNGLYFYPVTPCRVADTRNAAGAFGGPVMSGGSTRVFPIPSSACGIPGSAQAYSLNLTVAPSGPLGWLTAWPTGEAQPWVSTLNSSNGAILANAAIVPAGTNGAVSVYVSDTTHVIIDINGYFAAPGGAGALAFYPATPCRVADTRSAAGPFGGPSLAAGATRSFTLPSGACGIPSTAKAYSLNMTVVPMGSLGYLTTWPTGQAQPYVSTLNALQGQIAANAALVPAGTSGAISVYVSDASNVIVDVNGYFAPPGSAGALAFYPVSPCRVADTRNPTGTFGGPVLGAGSTRTFPIPSSSCALPVAAQAFSFNMTVVPPGQLLYLTTWPSGQAMPVVSTLNDMQGQIVANAAIVTAGSGSGGTGAVCVFVSDQTNLIIDANGYFAP